MSATSRPLVPVWVLAAWTLFVWGGRIRNVAADSELAGWGRAWRAGLALGFVAAATALVVLLARAAWRRRRASRARPARIARLAYALAAVGSAVWLVRGLDIMFGPHSAAFKIVHGVLAVVTIGLSGWVIRDVRSAGAGSEQGQREGLPLALSGDG